MTVRSLQRFGALLALTLAAVLGLTTTARASYNETFCDSSTAPPWTQGSADGGTAFTQVTNTCASPDGSYQLGIGSATLGFDGTWGVTLQAPPGVAITQATVAWTTAPWNSGTSEGFVRFGYGSSPDTIQSTYLMSAAPTEQSTTITPPTPSTSIFGSVFCSTSASTDCGFSTAQGILQLGETTLTLQDTGAPVISENGGGLTDGATVSGTQPVQFDASDSGSGVASVTVSLGSTVVGTYNSSCQPGVLVPCPATADDLVDADTTKVADGTYPVTLTAYDASGDATPISAGTVTVANDAITTTTTTAPTTTTSAKAGARRVNITMVASWRSTARGSKLALVTFGGKVSRKADISFTCVGKGCPFTRIKGSGAHLSRLADKLRGRRFRGGDRLILFATVPHRISQRSLIIIQKGQYPRAIKRISAKRLAKLEKSLVKPKPKPKKKTR